MALKTIFEETTFEASVYSEDFGCYCVFVNPMPFGFDVGSTYHVKWGEDTYECVGIDASLLIPGAAFIGNAEPFGLGGNNEPFCIGAPFGGAMVFLCLTDTEPTRHTVAIYREEIVNGIIVKDRDGNDVTHEGAYGIRARTTDGGMKVFVDADTIDKPVETSVELDFSEGDMEVLPSEGEVFSKIRISMPVNLKPEYIADGVEIAKITGELKGGASGTERKNLFPEQTITPTYDDYYGCYKFIATISGKITGDHALAIRFNGVWYVCSPSLCTGTMGSLTQTMTLYGNHKIMTKYFKSSISWKDTTAQSEPFLITTNAWIMTSSADSFTIRIDELIITE